mmetsp:Transcript_24941/g.56572  ORF Transcript_24941/g.56572 Transcript_24941/m.56572 type:complete len:363 (-) Transcript_24941:120-1208(-)
MTSSKKEEIKMRFIRITLLGASYSGKTGLANCFTSGMCPNRHIKTEKAVVYHRKVDVVEEGEVVNTLQPVFVEIEDTPGSERGNEDDDLPSAPQDAGGGPKPRLGARVVVEKDKSKLMTLFEDFKPPGRLKYKPGMDGMLGKEYTVRAAGKDGSFGLPSPDGSEGGTWNFPPGAFTMKLSLELPINQFLSMAEKKPPELLSLKDKKQYARDTQSPLLAYFRPIGGPDMDKTITRNRMGYFICFDMSDEEGDSLREAMEVFQLLMKSVEAKKVTRLRPLVWIVGCKSDKASEEAMQRNSDSAQIWSENMEIPFYPTSARTHKGVREVFTDMIQAISSRENLWSLRSLDSEDALEEEQGTCFSQ